MVESAVVDVCLFVVKSAVVDVWCVWWGSVGTICLLEERVCVWQLFFCFFVSYST